MKAPDGYPGKVYKWGNRVLEHHLVWWQNTGKLVEDGFVIHHRNGDGADNRFENLELLRVGEHTSRHLLLHEKLVVKCSLCDCDIERSGNDVVSKVRAGQRNFFCSSSHAAKWGHRRNGRDRVPHGTSSGYNYHGCRCDECRVYKSRAYMRRK